MIKFRTVINCFSENSLMWHYYIAIPEEIYAQMLKRTPDKRILCILNDQIHHYCAMMSKGSLHYILLNKSLFKKLGVGPDESIDVELRQQETKYGIPACDELIQILEADQEGSQYFHTLTIGTQRSLIHLINKYKNPQLRMDRILLLMRHLILRKGQLDFKILMSQFREGI